MAIHQSVEEVPDWIKARKLYGLPLASAQIRTVISPSKDDSQRQSRLMQLPGEVRNQILRNVVTQHEPLALRQVDAPFTIDLNVLYTCKQLREEASFFLYHHNTVTVDIECLNKRTYLHFSKRHTICEYHTTSFEEVADTFLANFTNYQFRFVHTRGLDSLRRVIGYARNHFHNKHITVLVPEALRSERGQPRVHRLPQLSSPFSPFSLLRCAYFSVIDGRDQDLVNPHQKLIDLVTSTKPVLDMAKQYERRQHDVRHLARAPIPLDMSMEEHDLLETTLFEHLCNLCDLADASDQDAFMKESKDFETCYRRITNPE